MRSAKSSCMTYSKFHGWNFAPIIRNVFSQWHQRVKFDISGLNNKITISHVLIASSSYYLFVLNAEWNRCFCVRLFLPALSLRSSNCYSCLEISRREEVRSQEHTLTKFSLSRTCEERILCDHSFSIFFV